MVMVLLLSAHSLHSPAAWGQKRTAAARKQATTKKQTTTKRQTATGKKQTTGKQKQTAAGKRKQETVSVQSLQTERKHIQLQIKEQERRLRNNEQNVRLRLHNLMAINTEIAGKRRVIDTIRHDISVLDTEIETLIFRLESLQSQLAAIKQNYVRSMRYMHRNRSSQSQLMFLLSADNVAQMFRRMRFMREYASYQRTQGEEVKTKQQEIVQQFQQLAAMQSHKQDLLARGERERHQLEDKQAEQQQVVNTLQKEQKTIQNIIAQQKKKDAALNEQIDRLIAEEVARQRARAEAEARRHAEAETARKRTAERTAKSSKTTPPIKTEVDTRATEPTLRAPSEDMRISGNFESNRGRLPIPITGSYRIVSHFGQYNVEGLRNVTLDNKGINILGEAGAQARSIFDGEVSAVFSFGSTMVVMVRHGSYISVYCNLASVSVQRGQKVSTRQTLGRVGQENILQFQLRRETAKLNPEAWLGR